MKNKLDDDLGFGLLVPNPKKIKFIFITLAMLYPLVLGGILSLIVFFGGGLAQNMLGM